MSAGVGRLGFGIGALGGAFACWAARFVVFTAKRVRNSAHEPVGFTAKRLQDSAQGGGFAEPWVNVPQKRFGLKGR
jgi:hypothetical protein